MERANIHPTREELGRYIRNSMRSNEREQISRHVESCEFCMETVRALGEFERFERESESAVPSVESRNKAHQLFRRMFRGQTFQLSLQDEVQPTEYLLAADGKEATHPAVENLATVYNVDPELVLKVMRDNRVHRTYLHLIGDNPALFSHVLIEAPQTNRTYVTNEAGQAEIEDAHSFDAASAKWQVKLPEAEFSLEPLTFDPDRPNYQTETVLKTERGDRVKLTFEGTGTAKHIKIEVLSLEGRSDAEPLFAAISVDNITSSHRGVTGKPILVNVDKLPVAVQIRIYR